MQSSDASRRENVRVCLSVTARSEATKQSIPPRAARWIASRSLSWAALRADPLARNDDVGCLNVNPSQILKLLLIQHLEHQLHRHQHRIVAAHQVAFGDAAEIVDQRDIKLGLQRAVGAGGDRAGAHR